MVSVAQSVRYGPENMLQGLGSIAWAALHGHYCMVSGARSVWCGPQNVLQGWAALHGQHCMASIAWSVLHGQCYTISTVWLSMEEPVLDNQHCMYAMQAEMWQKLCCVKNLKLTIEVAPGKGSHDTQHIVMSALTPCL